MIDPNADIFGNPWPIAELPRKRALYQKQVARRSVKNAVASGKLAKPAECSQCQRVKPPKHIHAHHTDYSRPLDVVWLCSSCHRRAH